MYGSCKVHKKFVNDWLAFRTILFVLQTPTYKFVKFLVAILEQSTTAKYTIKNLFNCSTKFFEQDWSNVMGSLDIDSIFTKISLKETIEICTNNLFKRDIVHGLKKVNLNYYR